MCPDPRCGTPPAGVRGRIDDAVGSDGSDAAPPAPQPPNAPANLRVSAVGEDFVEWTWNAVPGATGYVVQVSRDETFDDSDPIHVTVETTFTVTGLPPETSVYVRVAAASGTAEAPLFGAWTAQVAGMTAAPRPPASPTGLVVSATTENSIIWTWNAVAGATGYEVQFSRDAELTEADEVIDVSGRRCIGGRGSPRNARLSAGAVVPGDGDDRLRSGWTVALPAMTLVPRCPGDDSGRRPARGCHRGAGQARRRSGHAPRTLDAEQANREVFADRRPDRPRVGDRPACARTCHKQHLGLSALAGLTGLEQLNLHQNNISDISLLARLTGLEELRLSNNDISDISPLERLTGLERLFLGRINISDISPLARLTGLELLYLRREPTSRTSRRWRGLTGLEAAVFGRQQHLGHLAAGGIDRTEGAVPGRHQHLGHLGAGGIDRTGRTAPTLQQHLGPLAAGAADRTGRAVPTPEQHLGTSRRWRG